MASKVKSNSLVEEFVYPENSLMDSCEQDEDDDDNSGFSDDDEDDCDDEGDDFYAEHEPCKGRSFDVRRLGSLYNGVNHMGQVVEDAIKSFGSSRCGKQGPKVSNHVDKASWITDQLRRASFDGASFYPESTSSSDISNDGNSWDDEQSATFSKFMSRAKEDVKRFELYSAPSVADTATTATSSRGPSIQSHDDDDNDDDDRSSLLLEHGYSLVEANSHGEEAAANSVLIDSVSDQPVVLGTAKDIGEGMLLRTRSNVGTESKLLDIKTVSRSRSYDSFDLAKVAFRMNRHKLQASISARIRDSNVGRSVPRMRYRKALPDIVEAEEESCCDPECSVKGPEQRLKRATSSSKVKIASSDDKSVRFLPSSVQKPSAMKKDIKQKSRFSVRNKQDENNSTEAAFAIAGKKSRFCKTNVVASIQKRLQKKTGANQVDSTKKRLQTKPILSRRIKPCATILKSPGQPQKKHRKTINQEKEINEECIVFVADAGREQQEDDNEEYIVFDDDDEGYEVLLSGMTEETIVSNKQDFDQIAITAEQDSVEITAYVAPHNDALECHTPLAMAEECTPLDGRELENRHVAPQIARGTSKEKPPATNRDQKPGKLHTVLAGVTFEVVLPETLDDSETIMPGEEAVDQQTLNSVSARQRESEEFIDVKTKVFINMINPTTSTNTSNKEIAPPKKNGWNRKLQQRTSSFFGQKKSAKRTAKETVASNMTTPGEKTKERKDYSVVDHVVTEESSESPSYDVTDSTSSISFSFSESMKKVSMLHVISAINEELRIMNERSHSAA